VTFQKFIAPFLLNLIFVDFAETFDDGFQQQDFLFVGLTKFFKTFLQNVVSELTLDNFREIWISAQFSKDFELNVNWSFFDTDFNELGRVFILRKLYEIPFHFIKNLFIRCVIKSLKNFGNDEISKFVLNVWQSTRIFNDFSNYDLLGIFVFGILNEFFHNT